VGKCRWRIKRDGNGWGITGLEWERYVNERKRARVEGTERGRVPGRERRELGREEKVEATFADGRMEMNDKCF